jgi:hypothetical protein
LAGGHDYVIRRKRNILTCEKTVDAKADSSQKRSE